MPAAPRRPGDAPARHPFEPVDPDVDLHDPAQQGEWTRRRVVLPVIALGGVAGAAARHLVEAAYPAADGALPWATLGINAVGCLLIGVLMVLVVEVGGAHPLVRPFLGAGLLGGFTTFSTYTGEVAGLLDGGHPLVALAYLFGTVLVALVAVTLGVVLARRGVDARRPAGAGVEVGDA